MSCPVKQYALDVGAGRIVAGPWVRLACERHLRDLKDGKKRGLHFDEDLAGHALEFFPRFLRLAEGQFAGKPFELEPFQRFIVGSLYGWVTRAGFRRFRTAYIEVGKGNGKSPLAAGLGLYALVADDEPAAEIYAAAVTREQAGIAFRDAHLMAEASPELRAELDILTGNIANPSNGSFFRPVSSEHRGLDGKRPHLAIIDEIHEHPTSAVVDKMRAGTKARRQPLTFEITNSGYDRHSVCWHHHEYSLQVLQGSVENDSWFAYVAALDVADEKRGAAGDDPLTDEACWIKANPGLGTILPHTYLREQVREAVGIPASQSIVLRLNFCVWTERASRWIDMGLWAENDLDVDEDDLLGRPCFGGLDLSSTQDLTAFELVFPPQEDGERVQVLSFFWCPQDGILRRSKKDRVPYDQWEGEGYLRATPGTVVDYDQVRRDVVELGERYAIQEIAIDRWNATQLSTQLDSDGFVVVPFGQGFGSMAAPSKELEKRLGGRELACGGNPILRWMASNAAAKQDPAGNIKPDKGKSADKIDGIVALVMALGRMSVAPEDHEQDVEVMVL